MIWYVCLVSCEVAVGLDLDVRTAWACSVGIVYGDGTSICWYPTVLDTSTGTAWNFFPSYDLIQSMVLADYGH